MLIFGAYQTCQQIIQVMMERDVVSTTSSFPASEGGWGGSEYYDRKCMDICPPKFDFAVLNLTSMNQDPMVFKLNGLLIQGMQPGNPENDAYYYNTIMANEFSLECMMRIMYPLYEGKHVFICIDTLESHSFPAMQNDMLMWFIKERYGYNTMYVNCLEDFFSYDPDDCRFTTRGIMAFDQDKMRIISINEAKRQEAMGGQYEPGQPVIQTNQL